MTWTASAPSTVAFVGLGSNLGDSAEVLRAAARALDIAPQTRLLRLSSLYRTPAWGVTEQPDFVNAVAMLETGLSAQHLLAAMFAIEREAGRARRADGSDRWGPRTLDLDLLLYGDAVIDEPGLHVPHPHLHERAFALVPLLEIAPDAVIARRGPAREALQCIDAGAIRRLDAVDN
ncbi:2-amino-4-hydroxy-6-hydroxymethyldihydropteridine diphosphokinase [Lysobacter antibioticus]|uniref:2-amino-4-hydroxy-6-hydroxymethyldihydropteridine pyrophosphokinase n=1 Tax=Lysobacter antibioticus TaxID=84531 RepID=A0A0S2F9I0_LYSAN|nr:2-amino-4-hydroxy-6-hydroxymethyldihydropteridine diphosphokinase [Lysobacter antibioticus]ALN80201.1 2-amino-4-hydroxy-6- hydroxymethyldihydropteridine diphosphokinase [Lysobacter antibioticus]